MTNTTPTTSVVPATPAPATQTLTIAGPIVTIQWCPERDISRKLNGVGLRHGHMSLEHHPIAVTRHDAAGVFIVHDCSKSLAWSGGDESAPVDGATTNGSAKQDTHRAVVVPFAQVYHAVEELAGGGFLLQITMDPTKGELNVSLVRGELDKPSTWWRIFTGYTPPTHPHPKENHGKVHSSPAVITRDRARATADKTDRSHGVGHRGAWHARFLGCDSSPLPEPRVASQEGGGGSSCSG